MDKLDILRKYRIYTDVSDKLRSEFEKEGIAANLSAGDFFFHEGDDCSQMALLGEGVIRVYKTGASGREITLYHVQPGQTCVLTASGVLASKPYPASAVAESEIAAVIFPAPVFRQWVDKNEEVRNFVFASLADRMADVLSLVEAITFSKMDRRLAGYLVHHFSNKGLPLRVLHATHEQIAADLGTAREVISRLLKDFERAGAIQLARGRINLSDESMLVRFSEDDN